MKCTHTGVHRHGAELMRSHRKHLFRAMVPTKFKWQVCEFTFVLILSDTPVCPLAQGLCPAMKSLLLRQRLDKSFARCATDLVSRETHIIMCLTCCSFFFSFWSHRMVHCQLHPAKVAWFYFTLEYSPIIFAELHHHHYLAASQVRLTKNSCWWGRAAWQWRYVWTKSSYIFLWVGSVCALLCLCLPHR